MVLQNTVDMSLAIQTLVAQGYPVNHRYLTRHIKRYGDYVVNLQNIPQHEGSRYASPSRNF